MTDEDFDHCYECRGYGDDYSYDEETDELICSCDTCLLRRGGEADDD